MTFFVGENGTGKCTLMEAPAMALGCGAERGTRNTQFKTAGSVSTLHDMLRVARGLPSPRDGRCLRAESINNVATYMDRTNSLSGYGGRSWHAPSHGESFTAVLLHKLQGDGSCLLDEPACEDTEHFSATRDIPDSCPRRLAQRRADRADD